ncbi:tail fiber domain-containing protein [Rhodocytophaga aerolata]|uniref:Tail fiber domain-containing protein n=1 Tax=Rhodocytophaga aerolata TaxID=455078 RepID=A0ABT8R9N6_9BACT|nr:tail fiber domain-containing protein [Rhodocytophaga aerolata]MDO1448792.1 tail fiber domain-containing protein [Rhodocytophaga aerolata]
MKPNLYLCLATFLCVALSAKPAFSQSGNYFSGISAGANNTTGDYNAFAGYGAGINNTAGSLNTAFGFYAGASNKSTSFNTSIGAYAGYFTSSSFGENVFVGYRSGFYNSNGFYNVFLGSNAGYTNNSGSYNVIIGSGAGYDNTTGLSNTFIGYASGANNTTASSNTFVGNLAGFSNTTGASNSFFGSGTGTSNTTGTRNSIFGSGAGYYNNASDNAFLGYYAGRNNSTGNSNAFMGKDAGLNTTTGSSNTYLGRSSGDNNTTGYENTFVGRSAGTGNLSGFGNSALGYLAGPGVNNLSNATAIGHKSRVTGSNKLVLGSINGTNGATANTNVGIGTTSPSYRLHVNASDAAKVGGGSWVVASDKNLKQEVEPYQEGLSQVMAIEPVWFRYNGKAGLPTDKKYVGVIAQQVQQVAPHMIGEFIYQDTTGKQEKYLDYDANALTYMLVNAVKELKSENEQLKSELAQIKQMLNKQNPGSDAVARLWQNQPNPYGSSTLIRYSVPATASSAYLKVYSVTGQEVFSKQLLIMDEGAVEISTQILTPGTYIYHLVIDGNTVDNKKMVLTK